MMTEKTGPKYSAQEYKAASALFSAPCRFLRGVRKMDDVQQFSIPEIAFAGRSNVGKSSLLNALIRHKNMARVSNTPGRTQELNFFSLGDKLILVDMPGYGYAKVPVAERQSWDQFLPEYLSTRDKLKCVFTLVDARRGIKDNDIEMMDLLNQTGAAFQLIFTKCDQVKTQQIEILQGEADQLRGQFPLASDTAMFVSGKTRQGVDDLQASIYRLIKS